MPRPFLLLLHALLSVFAVLIANQSSAQPATPYYSDPAVSPDGSEIAFISGGDIWTVPAAGGTARLLVSNPAYESRPVYSPDGKYLAFVSTRSGNGDIYILSLQTPELRRLTFDDGAEELSAWSADGKYIYYSSSSREISSMRDVLRVSASGGTPMAVADNAYTSEFFGAPSPDGNTLALSGHGVASQQWWRVGRSHLDEAQIWLRREGSPATYTQLTGNGERDLWPMWSPGGNVIYYVSDKTGTANLYSKATGTAASAKQLTNFTNGRVLFPSISANGMRIVFERDFGIWSYDVASGKAAKVEIGLRGLPSGPSVERLRLTSQFSDLAVSPDGKKAAFIARGELFVSSAKDGGDAVKVSNTVAREAQPVWLPNSSSIIYLSERDDHAHLYRYDFITGKETRLTNTDKPDAAPLLSPDGKTLAFVRDGAELRTLTLATGKETLVTRARISRPAFADDDAVAWSPDSKWLAFSAYGAKSLRNVYVVPAGGGDARQISFLANSFGGRVLWSGDGRYILFTTAQRTETGRIARIDLVPQVPKFREDQFRQLFVQPNEVMPPAPVAPPQPEKKTAADTLAKRPPVVPKETVIVFEGIARRLNLLPLAVDVNSMVLSRDGHTLLVSGAAAGQVNLYTYSLDELSREQGLRQLTTMPGFKTAMQFTADGRDLFYLESGRIQSIGIDSKQVKPLAVTAELEVDFSKEKTEIFREAWDVQNVGYYDPAFHGADWQAVRNTYAPLAAGAQTPDELRRILSLMVGELNSSHSGVSAPQGASFSTGRIGLKFDRGEYESSGKFRIADVLPLGATGIAGGVKAGDYLVSIDGQPVTANSNLDQLLDNKVGKKTQLGISPSANGDAVRMVSVLPMTQSTEKGLMYRQWVQQQRDYVAKISGGRLGYVHMFDMSDQSLSQLYLDMDAENLSREGVIVDIRNNNGGFVNAYALDVLSRRGYLTMTGRDLPPAPARTQLGQRALQAPTVLVTNQHSLSDAEDFTEGYREMGLGKVVGEPTGGWIIFTSSAQLIDGTSVRLPFIKITDNKGQDMELHPRPVDVAVSRPLGEGNGKDSQLDAAVKVLLQELDKAKK